MKELDFDELDRAVNSLMTNKKTADTIEDQSAAVDYSSPTPQVVAGDRSQVPRSVSMPKAQSPNATLASARRPMGRFMDVVHPSGGIKKPASSVSRQTVALRPPSSLRKIPGAQAAPLMTVAKTVDAPQTEPVVTQWPELTQQSDNQTLVDDKTSTGASLVADEPSLFTGDTPLTSPFLTGTKVEKRPLGGLQMSDAPSIEDEGLSKSPVLGEKINETATVHDPEDQLPALPKDVEPTLPAELQDDLIAIESRGAAADTLISAQPEKPIETSPIDISPKEEQDIGKPVDEVAVTPQKPAVSQPVVPVGPISIPQQYKEEPSTGDQHNGAIYDTDAYHQPLAHPAKQRSGWMWVLWIVLILLVGAGAGAALYFFRFI